MKEARCGGVISGLLTGDRENMVVVVVFHLFIYLFICLFQLVSLPYFTIHSIDVVAVSISSLCSFFCV